MRVNQGQCVFALLKIILLLTTESDKFGRKDWRASWFASPRANVVVVVVFY